MKKEFIASFLSREPHRSGFFQPPSAWQAPVGPGERVLGVADLPRQHGVGARGRVQGRSLSHQHRGFAELVVLRPRGPVQSLQGGEASLTLGGLPGVPGCWESSLLQEGNERRSRAHLARLELGCRPLHSSDFVAGPLSRL